MNKRVREGRARGSPARGAAINLARADWSGIHGSPERKARRSARTVLPEHMSVAGRVASSAVHHGEQRETDPERGPQASPCPSDPASEARHQQHDAGGHAAAAVTPSRRPKAPREEDALGREREQRKARNRSRPTATVETWIAATRAHPVAPPARHRSRSAARRTERARPGADEERERHGRPMAVGQTTATVTARATSDEVLRQAEERHGDVQRNERGGGRHAGESGERAMRSGAGDPPSTPARLLS